jgi:serine/threonine-protein kinase RsbW
VNELRVVIDSSFDAVAGVGEAVRALCRSEGMSESDAAMVELAIVEWINNAIEHAYAGTPGGEIAVSLVVDAQQVAAEIVDDGRPLDGGALLSHAAPEFDPADRASLPEGGFGIGIIRNVFDEVTFGRERERNRATFRKRREGAQL